MIIGIAIYLLVVAFTIMEMITAPTEEGYVNGEIKVAKRKKLGVDERGKLINLYEEKESA